MCDECTALYVQLVCFGAVMVLVPTVGLGWVIGSQVTAAGIVGGTYAIGGALVNDAKDASPIDRFINATVVAPCIALDTIVKAPGVALQLISNVQPNTATKVKIDTDVDTDEDWVVDVDADEVMDDADEVVDVDADEAWVVV